MTVESAHRVLTVASNLAEQGRRLVAQSVEWRALALAEVPAGTVLTFDARHPRLLPVDAVLQADGSLRNDVGSSDPEWVAEQWQRGNLRLPTVDGD